MQWWWILMVVGLEITKLDEINFWDGGLGLTALISLHFVDLVGWFVFILFYLNNNAIKEIKYKIKSVMNSPRIFQHSKQERFNWCTSASFFC